VLQLSQEIDTKILTVHRMRESSIRYSLPTNFSFIGMTREDIQLIVYTDLIKLYKGKGFVVNICIDDNGAGEAYLFISWVNGISSEERAERKKILKQAM
jgi:hypothetical protein